MEGLYQFSVSGIGEVLIFATQLENVWIVHKYLLFRNKLNDFLSKRNSPLSALTYSIYFRQIKGIIAMMWNKIE